jgi:hypothetical protein
MDLSFGYHLGFGDLIRGILSKFILDICNEAMIWQISMLVNKNMIFCSTEKIWEPGTCKQTLFYEADEIEEISDFTFGTF